MSRRLEIILDNHRAEFTNVIVRELLKSYIHHMPVEAAQEQLSRIVNLGVNGICINGEELAALIEKAKAAVENEVMEWNAQEDEPLLKTIIDFMQEDFLPTLDGRQYVAAMPIGMRKFLSDCLMEVSGGGVN